MHLAQYGVGRAFGQLPERRYGERLLAKRSGAAQLAELQHRQ